MWQDALALLIVGIAALVLLRTYLPSGLFRFGPRRKGAGSAESAPSAGGCGGCASGSSCAKVRFETHPIVIRRRERFPVGGR